MTSEVRRGVGFANETRNHPTRINPRKPPRATTPGCMSALGVRLASPLAARRVLLLAPRRVARFRTHRMAAPSARFQSMSSNVGAEVGADDASSVDAVTRTGTCLCGAVSVVLTGKPTAVSICHCVICRKLSGAPFSAQALVKATQVAVVANDEGGGDAASSLTSYASSPAVERHRCASCQSPVYATLAKGKMAAVPLAMLDAARDDAAMAPTHHMYYADRIMDVPDHLPKYVKSAGRQAELWKGD